MITESTIYWITRLDEVKELFFEIGIVLTVFTVATLLVGGLIILDGTTTEAKWGKKVLRKIPVIVLSALLFFIVSVLTPTTKEMCAIKIVPLIANDEQVQELPSKFVDLANEWFEELKPNKSEQGN